MRQIAAILLLTAASFAARGASFATAPSADAFVTTGPSGNLSGNNYGGAGSISLAAPGSAQGEFQSVLRFALGGAVGSFDSTFGAGQWSVQSVVLRLTAATPGNPIFNASAAGSFAVSWMQNDTWAEGTGNPASPGATGITYSSLQNVYIGAGDESLGTFGFGGATSGTFDYSLALTPGLLADVLGGNDLSLRLLAADSTVSGVFNSRSFISAASRPSLTVTAVPEPGTFALCGVGLALLGRRRSRRRVRAA
jgi:hypothetical protein